MINYLQDTDNLIFIAIVFGLFIIDYIIERIKTRNDVNGPSIAWVFFGPLGVLLVWELLYFLFMNLE